jgi:CheY-like chemotaxis protein
VRSGARFRLLRASPISSSWTFRGGSFGLPAPWLIPSRRGYAPRCTVLDTGDGQRALETLADAAGGGVRVPDVVVLDVRMPGCSGLGVLSAMRRLSRRPRTILVTGFRDPSIQVVAERLGAARVLFKPVALDEVLSAVREALAAAAH